MHFVTCEIRLAGDMLNTVPRDTFRPVSWPEVEVLRLIHGDASIVDVKPFVRVEQSAKAEKERLRHIYGNEIVETVFPGRNPQMEMEAPGAKLPEQIPLWKSPIDIEPAGYDVPPEERRPAAKQEDNKPKRNYGAI